MMSLESVRIFTERSFHILYTFTISTPTRSGTCNTEHTYKTHMMMSGIENMCLWKVGSGTTLLYSNQCALYLIGLVHKLCNHAIEFGSTDALSHYQDILLSSGYDLDNGIGYINGMYYFTQNSFILLYSELYSQFQFKIYPSQLGT